MWLQAPFGTLCIADVLTLPATLPVAFLWNGRFDTAILCTFQQRGGDGQMTPVLRLCVGACAGIVGMSATYPLDMVRGRLTIQAGKGGQYHGIMHATTSIIKEVRRVVYIR